MASKPNKYHGNGKLYSKDNPRSRSEDGIIFEGYFHPKGSVGRTTESRIRPLRSAERAAKRAKRGY